MPINGNNNKFQQCSIKFFDNIYLTLSVPEPLPPKKVAHVSAIGDQASQSDAVELRPNKNIGHQTAFGDFARQKKMYKSSLADQVKH